MFIASTSRLMLSSVSRAALPSIRSITPALCFFASSTDKLIYIKDDSTYNTLKAGSKPSIMNYSALWCGPCKRMAPTFANLSSQNSDINFVKIDVDQSGSIAESEGIRSVPTYKLYKENKLLSEFAGADVSSLDAMIAIAKKA